MPTPKGPNAVPQPASLSKGSIPAPPKSVPEATKEGINSIKSGR